MITPLRVAVILAIGFANGILWAVLLDASALSIPVTVVTGFALGWNADRVCDFLGLPSN